MRRMRGALHVLALCCVGAVPVAALAQLPVGIVEFRIESATVAGALGPNRDRIAAAMSAHIAARADEYFGFLRWAPGTFDGSRGFALIVRLTEQPSELCAPHTMVLLQASLGAASAQSPPVDLYDGCDPRPPFRFSELAPLERDLELAIDKLFEQPIREDLVFRSLLTKISLTDTLMVDHDMMQVFLPLTLRDLKASPASEITVEFDTATAPGLLLLKPLTSVSNSTLCEINEYKVPPPLNITARGGFYHPSFEQVFPRGNMPRVRVFMTSYVADRLAGQISTDGIIDSGPD